MSYYEEYTVWEADTYVARAFDVSGNPTEYAHHEVKFSEKEWDIELDELSIQFHSRETFPVGDDLIPMVSVVYPRERVAAVAVARFPETEEGDSE